jgi:hypothetical protein
MLRQNIMFEGELHHFGLAENTVILNVNSTTRLDELKSTLESLGAKQMDPNGEGDV